MDGFIGLRGSKFIEPDRGQLGSAAGGRNGTSLNVSLIFPIFQC